MNHLISVTSADSIPKHLVNTPFESLLLYHNLKNEFRTYQTAQLLISMCMDNRKYLHIPDNFAYILRTGGGNLKRSEFKVSYAIGVGNVKHIALIAHENCGMVNIEERKNLFIQGLITNAGWSQSQAIEHFEKFAPIFEIENETEFVISEANRLRQQYPKIQIAPFMYKITDNQLYIIQE